MADRGVAPGKVKILNIAYDERVVDLKGGVKNGLVVGYKDNQGAVGQGWTFEPVNEAKAEYKLMVKAALSGDIKVWAHADFIATGSGITATTTGTIFLVKPAEQGRVTISIKNAQDEEFFWTLSDGEENTQIVLNKASGGTNQLWQLK